ncbi:hypothetical protein DFH28DRAFT_489154 [Melampsora americana]|nr:hypothetical protein DFH28DRAFT_489154 [Melampsora americana]
MRQPTITFIYILILSLLQLSPLRAIFSSSRLKIKRNTIDSLIKVSDIPKSDIIDGSRIVNLLKEKTFDTPSTSKGFYKSQDPSEISTVKPIQNEITEESIGNRALEQSEISELETDRTMDQDSTKPQLRAADIIYQYWTIVSQFPTPANSEMKAMWCLLNGAQLDKAEAHKLGRLLTTTFADFAMQYKERLTAAKKPVTSWYPAFMELFENFYKAHLSTLPKNWDSIIEGVLEAIELSRQSRLNKVFENLPDFDKDISKAGSDISAKAARDLIEVADAGPSQEIELGSSDPERAFKLAAAKSLGLSNAADSEITLYEFWKGLQQVSEVFTQRGVYRKLIENYEKEMILRGEFKRIRDRFPELLDLTKLPSSSQQIDQIETKVKDGPMMAENQEYQDAMNYLFGSKTEEIREFEMNDPETVHKESWIFSDAVLNSPKCIEEPEICFDYYLKIAKTMKTQKGIDNFAPPLAGAFLNKLIRISQEKDRSFDWPEPASHLLRTTFGTFFDKHSILQEKRISLLRAIHEHVQTFDKPEEFNPFFEINRYPFLRFPYIRDVNYFTEARSRLISGDAATIRFIKDLHDDKYETNLAGENRLISDLKFYDQEANLEISRFQDFWTQMIGVFESTRDQPGTPRDLMSKFPDLLDKLKQLAPERKSAREQQWKEWDKAVKEEARLAESNEAFKEKASRFGCVEFIRTATSWVCKRYRDQPSPLQLTSE